MRETRNPFRLRTSEKIESTEGFLRLFGPGVMDLLPRDEPWKQILILRSAPGGGKTSLMRVFTPQSLHSLHSHRYSDEYTELNSTMRELRVLAEDGPQVLGVMLSCGGDYASIADMSADGSQLSRLFLSLLNSRIIIAGLRAICGVRGCEYPRDLSLVEVRLPDSVADIASLQGIATGKDLFDWAVGIESAICDSLDRFGSLSIAALPGHNRLFALEILHHETFLIGGHPVAKGVLLMLDDIQELAPEQRRRLVDIVAGDRPRIGIWIAERYEALSVRELLSSGAISGRDFGQVVDLERFWRSKANGGKFERAVLGIADRRARSGTDSGVQSFGGNLVADLEEPSYAARLKDALETVSNRVRERAEVNSEFARWLEPVECHPSGTVWEQAISWRMMEIEIAREMGRTQKRLPFAISDDAPEFEPKSGVKAAAELFLAEEFNLPYYYGPSRLASLSSTNIQQFVWLAGDLFEEVLAASLLKRSTHLSPERQEAIIRKAVDGRWRRLPQELRYGREVRAFLEKVGMYAREVTYKPNAPYVPGVTGIAISMRDRDVLRDPQTLKENPQLNALARVIAACIASNLFEPILDYRVKKKEVMVLYLNRMLCVQFGLPLGYGGFREQSLSKLLSWLVSSPIDKGTQGELL